MYHERLIDNDLVAWAEQPDHKPLLLRGARQVGKSTAVRQLGKRFKHYVEINFEKQPTFKSLFADHIDVRRIVPSLSAMSGKTIEVGNTLLFLDEIQACPEAIMSLRFFKEDLPDLHVVAAGSLLEFALEELPTYGVGRIHSMFMHPMSFDEFLMASGEQPLMEVRNQAAAANPLPEALHLRLVELLRSYILVGGMPEVVSRWVATHDFVKCQQLQDDILLSYEDDFPKYRKRVNPTLLRHTLRSIALQSTRKFVYAQVGESYKTEEVRRALEMLTLAGIAIPVYHTAANGLPLGSEADYNYRKVMLLDTGLTLRLLSMTLGNTAQLTTQILTASVAELVNKGVIAEQLVGLELMRYASPNLRHELFYWVRRAKNSQAEIDYVVPRSMHVLPIEVKAGTQGGMKSLWSFMREKHLTHALRCSLENFGTVTFVDKEEGDALRQVEILPIYALSLWLRGDY